MDYKTFDIVDVVAGIIVKNGKVLIAKKSSKVKELSGKWEFPGGKIEKEEPPPLALVREIREEMGIDIEVGPFIAESFYSYPHITVRILAYLCAWKGGNITLKDHSEVVFVSPQELLSYDLLPADIPIAKKIIELMGKN